jgi:hypothetical protein
MIFQIAALALALSPQTAPQVAPTPAPEAERKVCKREEPTVGSRLARSTMVCRSAAEWAAERSQRDADMDSARRSSR